MNIGENYFCSRCFYTLSGESICPSCGHDPEQEEPLHVLEEGTLLDSGRYQIGAVADQNDLHILYGAWDHQLSRPVYVREYFPRKLVRRDHMQSNIVSVKETAKTDYETGLDSFCKKTGIQTIGTNGTGTGTVIEVFKKNRTGYLILSPTDS